MQIAIRVDASVRIGSGHVMRCLTLAEALRQEGAEVTFLCREDPGHMGEEIVRQGFEVGTVGNHKGCPYADDEIGESQRALPSGIDLLIVDHYALGREFEEAMRPFAGTIMAIDDLARDHDCDILLDQNLLPDMEERYRGKVPEHCRLLLGPAYALLREEFRREDVVGRERDGNLQHLLIFFGGSDPDNLTGRTLRALEDLPLTADVVIGRSNPHRREIEALCRRSGGRWKLHVQTDRMAELMAAADLAIGAGGGTHWERCRMGLPAVVVTIAENQVETTRLLHEKGACSWLGDAGEVPEGALRRAVGELRCDPERLLAMSRAAQEIIPVDGGANRVAGELKKPMRSK